MISTAYERTSLIVTTNSPFENWTEVLRTRAGHLRDVEQRLQITTLARNGSGGTRKCDPKAACPVTAIVPGPLYSLRLLMGMYCIPLRRVFRGGQRVGKL